MKIRTTVALLLITISAVPAVAQNRFMDQAREAADRRAEHKAVREAENPDAVAKPAAPAAAEAAPAAPAQAQAAPAEPAAPAAQAQAAPAAPAAPAR